MADLIAFLRARLDDDEQTARAAAAAIGGDDDADVPLTIADDAYEAVAEHIARHDPARALAEVEAKRLILLIHNTPAAVSPKLAAIGLREGEAPEDDRSCMGCGLNMMEDPITADVNACPILRALALPYADHPDYQDSWRP
ncbi:DUF6221 family protein [Streptomyces sp. SP18ES09]|uniref:DUF6221 family protein n=1 Tax=Streptomyces sp. SP18ES09 TaxID=3002532 RepID=UPI002E772B74|nr:DUF6221 family protein [Streptomyces sp. SP18ES09]MEE1814225.1 DUF6221 family protein [Streptomyces sp. SP18ES09]